MVHRADIGLAFFTDLRAYILILRTTFIINIRLDVISWLRKAWLGKGLNVKQA